jgi:hypothetical protein
MLRLMEDGQTVDTIAEVEVPETNVVVVTSGGRRVGVPRPFSDAPLYEVMADATGLVSVRRRAPPGRRSSTYEVIRVSLNGDTVFRRAYPYEPKPVTRALISDAVATIRDRPVRGRAQLEESEILRALRDGGHIPETLPPVTAVASGLDGSIWIRREKDESEFAIWEVLDGNGARRATLGLGRNQIVKVFAGDVLIVTDFDELDVPYVIRYRIEKSRSDSGERPARTREDPPTRTIE